MREGTDNVRLIINKMGEVLKSLTSSAPSATIALIAFKTKLEPGIYKKIKCQIGKISNHQLHMSVFDSQNASDNRNIRYNK